MLIYRINIWNMLIVSNSYKPLSKKEKKKKKVDYIRATIQKDWQKTSVWKVLIIIKVFPDYRTSRFKRDRFIQIFSRFWNSIKGPIERESRANVPRFFLVQFIFHTMLDQASAQVQ